MLYHYYIMVYGKHISSENPNKCKDKENIYTISLAEVSHTIKIQNFDHHLSVIRTYSSLPA